MNRWEKFVCDKCKFNYNRKWKVGNQIVCGKCYKVIFKERRIKREENYASVYG